MKKLLLAMLLSVVVSPWALAHEGGEHKVMGTVAMIHENHLEVNGTDGKKSTVTLNDKTRILRGKVAVKSADIKAGDRIVVTATETKDKQGKTTLVATEVILAPVSSPTRTSNATTSAPTQAGGSHHAPAAGARAQAIEYIGHYHSIKLTPEQEKIKTQALSGIPAPCCKEYAAATCCCPCNLAKAIWGLSHYLIAKQGYGAERVKTSVQEWLRSTNPSGYTGDACFTGGCQRAFAQNGCGGMDERNVL